MPYTNKTRRVITGAAIAISAMTVISCASFAQTAQTAHGQSQSFYAVKSASTQTIRLGVKAFKKADYDLAVNYNMRALSTGLAPARKVIAYSNLCAAYGAHGDVDEAIEACSASLNLDSQAQMAKDNLALAQAAKLAAR